jgi:hypothetical protein
MRTTALLMILLLADSALGQSLTTGAIQGRVTDKESGEGLPGVTVSAGSQITITDEDGAYKLSDLVPGRYVIELAFDTATTTRSGVIVNANAVTILHEAIKIGEAIHIDGTPPPIRTTSTAKETLVTREQLESLAIPGTTIASAIGIVPGSQNDGVGTALSGSTGLENRWLVDGIDITGLTYGDLGTPVLNEFVHEIQIVSGGYNAEYGRATGGIINVITRSGTDTLRGSLFGVYTPGFLTARRDIAPNNASSIDVTANNAYTGHVGFELGGPIVPRRAWFYVGVGAWTVAYVPIAARCRPASPGLATASPTSIRRPGSTSPTRSTRRSAAPARDRRS